MRGGGGGGVYDRKMVFHISCSKFHTFEKFRSFGSKGYTKETKIADAEVVRLIMPSNTDLSRNQI